MYTRASTRTYIFLELIAEIEILPFKGTKMLNFSAKSLTSD
jgi:hypothetical protein